MINLTTRSALGHNGFHGDAGFGASRFSTLEGSARGGLGRRAAPASSSTSTARRSGPLPRPGLVRQLPQPRRHPPALHSATTCHALRIRLLPVHRQRRPDGPGRPQPSVPGGGRAGPAGRLSRLEPEPRLPARRGRAAGCSTPRSTAATTSSQLDGSADDTPVTADTGPLARQPRDQLSSLQASSAIATSSRREHRRSASRSASPSASGSPIPASTIPAPEGYNPNSRPYDLTRGGSLRLPRRADRHLRRRLRSRTRPCWNNLTVNAGLRYDHNNLFETESQLQPRVGLAYYIPATRTVLRASYDRMFITPEYENILLSSSRGGGAGAARPPGDASQLGAGQLFNLSERPGLPTTSACSRGSAPGSGSTSPTGSARSRTRPTRISSSTPASSSRSTSRAAISRAGTLRLDGGP